VNSEENTKILDFFDILYKYVSISGNLQRVKNEIGLRRAVVLKSFLRDYLESTQEDVYAFAGEFLKKHEI